MIQARTLEIWFEGKELVEVTCLQSKYFKRKVDPEYFIFGHIHGQQIKASQEYQKVDKGKNQPYGYILNQELDEELDKQGQ